MNEQQRTSIEALLLVNDLSLSNQKTILTELNSLLIECTQDLYDNGIKFEDAGLFEKLLFQIIFHNETLLTLTSGKLIEIRDKQLKINDLTAVYSITRLQIETFINLSYIFFVDSEYSKEIKASVYKIQGLRKQIELNKKYPKDFEPIKKMRNELAEKLRKIRKLNEFKRVPFSKRKRFTNPSHARLIKLDKIYPLIKIGNISRTHSLYSNHIHSEYISIRQLKSAINDNSEYESSFSTVTLLCSRITSLVITNMVEQYELKNYSYSKAPLKLKKVIESINKLSSMLK